MKTKELFQLMNSSVENGTAKVLTINDATPGKKIHTIYYGYAGQDGVDSFEIGKVDKEVFENGNIGSRLTIYRTDGSPTYIFCDNGINFWCTDSDRYVYFIDQE